MQSLIVPKSHTKGQGGAAPIKAPYRLSELWHIAQHFLCWTQFLSSCNRGLILHGDILPRGYTTQHQRNSNSSLSKQLYAILNKVL